MAETAIAVQTAPEATSLKIVEHDSLLERVDRVRREIAQRAYEIFERTGKQSGRDLDNWFEAESQLLHPAHLSLTESDDFLNIEAEVGGFRAAELAVSLAANRLTITGKKEAKRENKNGAKMIYQEQCSSELLRIIDLPAEVDAAKSTATLRNGMLELTMPRAASAKATRTATKAA